jgi:hypothetical protein
VNNILCILLPSVCKSTKVHSLCSMLDESLKVAVQGLDFKAHPLYIHTYIHVCKMRAIIMAFVQKPREGNAECMLSQSC